MERRIITHSTQLTDPERVAGEISAMITGYNSGHSYEMLPKSTEVVLHQLDSGLSVVIISPEDEAVLFHGSLYSNFEDGEDEILGRQVVELGSWIVPEKFRGHNLGTHGVAALIELGRERWENPLFISTHKRIGALKVSQHNGLEAIPYNAVPYLTYLTCTCTNCSETVGKICGFRRTSEIVVYEDGKIDCSLVASGIGDAISFDQTCRALHQDMKGEVVMPGPITINSMIKTRNFFEGLKSMKS